LSAHLRRSTSALRTHCQRGAVGGTRWGRFRCDARATRAAAVPPSRRWTRRNFTAPRRSVACGAGLPLASLRFSPPQKSPPPGTAHRAATLVVFDCKHLGAAGKAVGGQAGARVDGAEQRSDPRGIATPPRAAARRRACRVPSAAALRSSVAPARGRGAEPPLGREQRRGPWPAGPRRWRERALACPHAALQARSTACAHSGHRPTAATGRMRPLDIRLVASR
jgi:hypothetical protein